MSRNIVPRVNKGADLGTSTKNWNRLYTDAVIVRGDNLRNLLNDKTDRNTLIAKGDLYTATGPGEITRLPRGTDGYVLKANSASDNGLMWGPAGARQELTNNITFTVGNGGDFSTINTALEHIVSLYYSKYLQTPSPGVGGCPRVIINLLPDFVMSEQVLVNALDLSWITITGYDDETIIDKDALIIQFDAGRAAFSVGNGGCLPIIEQLFTMSGSGYEYNKYGIIAYNCSRAIVSPNCGVKNSRFVGIYATNSSIIQADGAIASEACQYGIVASKASIINANNAIVTNSGEYGVFSQYGSIVNASSADATGAGIFGFTVHRGSIINAYNSTGTLSEAQNELTTNGIIFK